jgi:hypothetical protein
MIEERQCQKSSKLGIITRDGKSYHEFIHINNLSESDCKRIKCVEDCYARDLSGFVLIRPLPFSSHTMLNVMEAQGIRNKTKDFKF